jgi:hypothetical protein
MSTFGLGRKEQPPSPLPQILQINEEVFVVVRQSRLKPGGSAFTPNIVFGTDRT